MLLREQAGPLTDTQRKMLEEADRSCARIGALISEMSELGKIEGGELNVPSARFDLVPLVQELASDMHEGEDRGIRLDVRATGSVIVAGDRTRVGSAIKGLIRAALRERGEPGVIVVECSTVADMSHMWAVVTIGDEASADKLRDGARTVPPRTGFDEWRGGLGLTLPIGRRVIEAHGGAVWSAPKPRPRDGSAVRLPLAEDLQNTAEG